MKRIIQDGVKTYRATCTECGCVFTYERGDVSHNYVRGGEWVSCPSCGHSRHHFGVSGVTWPSERRGRTACSNGGYQPIGPVPRGSCFGDN